MQDLKERTFKLKSVWKQKQKLEEVAAALHTDVDGYRRQRLLTLQHGAVLIHCPFKSIDCEGVEMQTISEATDPVHSGAGIATAK